MVVFLFGIIPLVHFSQPFDLRIRLFGPCLVAPKGDILVCLGFMGV